MLRRLFGDRRTATGTVAGGTAEVPATLYHCNPFGETNDGEEKAFVLQRDGVTYFPAFESVDSMQEFYAGLNRGTYLILEGTLEKVEESIRSMGLTGRAAITIEPLTERHREILLDP